MLWTKRINKPGSNPLTFEESRVGGDYLIMARGEYENLMEEVLGLRITPPERHPFRDPDIEAHGKQIDVNRCEACFGRLLGYGPPKF